jgi:hypothetical protein
LSVERTLKAISSILGSHGDVDQAAAIMRVPHTWNLKYDKPRPVVIEKFSETRYSMEELEEAFSPYIKSAATTKSTRPAIVGKNPEGWVEIALQGVKKGNRTITCTKLVGYYIRLTHGDEEAAFSIVNNWDDRNDPPMKSDDPEEIRKIVRNIARKDREGYVSATFPEILHPQVTIERFNPKESQEYFSIRNNATGSEIELMEEELKTPAKAAWAMGRVLGKYQPMTRKEHTLFINFLRQNSVEGKPSPSEKVEGKVAIIIQECMDCSYIPPREDRSRKPAYQEDGEIIVDPSLLAGDLNEPWSAIKPNERISPRKVMKILKEDLGFTNESTKVKDQSGGWKPLRYWRLKANLWEEAYKRNVH